jgi:methylenetetrahydrofolate dehydrogenase (NADP+) / methenyltetrahydrofolate cyclohydrolase
MVTEKSMIIDVGSTFVDGVSQGDADFENLQDFVQAITPVPG